MDFVLKPNWKEHAVKIGQGERREVYSYQGVVVKEIYNPRRNNLNLIDYNNFLILQDFIFDTKFKENFIKLNYINNFVVSEIVRNYDGNISENLMDFKGELPDEFWSRIWDILIFLMEKKLYFFDLNRRNILVKKISKDIIIPVFFDYKGINRKYFFQFNLFFKSEREKKVLRRFERLKEKVEN